MNPLMIMQLLLMIAEAAPKLTTAVRDALQLLRGEKVTDITQEEFEARIDAAIAKLPEWE